MLISVVIPTHDRHRLLGEAIASVESQSHKEWELIVVDDASTPDVVLHERDSSGANMVRLLRNPEALGPSGARSAGMQVATGDVVMFLDDDDLLANNALESVAKAFGGREDLDCLFINVDPFGEEAEGTRENQAKALGKILGQLGLESRTTTGLLALPDNLFEVLLDGVPMAFQRVAMRRAALSKVGKFTGRGFEDIEFYYRIALRCRCALLVDAVHRLRCHGQSYFSRIDAKADLIDATIRIRENLLMLPDVSVSSDKRRHVSRALADARFNKAYFAYETGKEFPWKNYLESCAMGVTWPHLSMLIKALPRLVSRGKAVGRH